MAKENAYVGRYGNALRRLTALEAQSGALGTPQPIGGADTGGFGPSLPAQQVAPDQGFGPPMQSPLTAAPAPAAPPAQAGGFGAAPSPTFGTPPALPDVLGKTPGIAGPIQTGGDKPTSWGDLVGGASEEEQDQLVAEVEKQGKGKMDGFIAKVRKVLGTEDVPKMSRRETASYIAEIALRAMSKRSDPRYAQNPEGVFADAVLETSALRKEAAEKARLEERADTETKRKEAREDAKDEKVYGRSRADKIADDERNHKQAIELARIQAQLMREKGKKTSIITSEDGTLVLVDEDGNAVDITKEVEETVPAKGSRGQGTTGGGTRKVRKPVKAQPKPSGKLDEDTVLNKITQVETELRKDAKLMRELRTKFNRDSTKVEDELRRMAREKVQGDVQSLGTPGSGGKVIDFNDL